MAKLSGVVERLVVIGVCTMLQQPARQRHVVGMANGEVERREVMVGALMGRHAGIRIRAMGEQEVGGCQHVGFQLWADMDEARAGKVHKGRCGPQIVRKTGRIDLERGFHRLATVERDLKPEQAIGEIRGFVQQALHHMGLAMGDGELQALDARGTVHAVQLHRQLERRPALKAVLLRNDMQKIGVLEHGTIGTWRVVGDAMASMRQAGFVVAFERACVAAQLGERLYMRGSGHRIPHHGARRSAWFGHEKYRKRVSHNLMKGCR
jgi:hypothetical protein